MKVTPRFNLNLKGGSAEDSMLRKDILETPCQNGQEIIGQYHPPYVDEMYYPMSTYP